MKARRERPPGAPNEAGAVGRRPRDDPLARPEVRLEPVRRVAVRDDEVLLGSLETSERANEAEDELLDAAGAAAREELGVDRDAERAFRQRGFASP